MTDASGTLVWAADYLPFGQADVTIAAVENNLRFAGQYYDSETGLHYNYWRFYDPKLGRYLRADPIGLAGGINPYAYVDSNPLSNIDPYGLDTTIWVTRLNSNSISLTGQISAVSSNTGASLSGYTLEHGTGSAFPHINEGTYSAIIQTHSYATGKKYSIPMIRVLGSNVAGGQIHNGSNLGDSAGCTLAANNEGKNQNTISGSRNFMRDLNNLIQNDGGKITVIYTDLSGLVR